MKPRLWRDAAGWWRCAIVRIAPELCVQPTQGYGPTPAIAYRDWAGRLESTFGPGAVDRLSRLERGSNAAT